MSHELSYPFQTRTTGTVTFYPSDFSLQPKIIKMTLRPEKNDYNLYYL
jgi:hypothetical protein